MGVEIRAARWDEPVARELVAALDRDLNERYAADDAVEGEPDHAMLNILDADVAPPLGTFLVAWLDDRPVGCGAVRPHDAGVAEVKRMYVDPSARGLGIGRALLSGLAEAAAGLGYRRLVLETGIRQQEAMALYESAGWTPIPSYGAYRHSTLSRCYELVLEDVPPDSSS